MIRHLFELAAFLLLFGVGLGLIVASGAGLLLIWRPEFERSQTEEEYRRVERAGRAIASLPARVVYGVPVWDEPDGAIRRASIAPRVLPHPYDWAKREPMVWARPQ